MVILRLLRNVLQSGLFIFLGVGLLSIIRYLLGIPGAVTDNNILLYVLFTGLAIVLFIWVWKHDWERPDWYTDAENGIYRGVVITPKKKKKKKK